MKRGRPTSYKPEYADLLIEHMSRGLSFESFAGHPDVRVNRDTIYNWLTLHDDFSDACKRGQSAALLFMEELGMTNLLSPPGTWSMTLWIFLMKTRFGWRDGTEGTKVKLMENNEKLDNLSNQLAKLINGKAAQVSGSDSSGNQERGEGLIPDLGSDNGNQTESEEEK